MLWLISDRGDQDVRRLIDGESFGGGKPHYSRQSPGHPKFTRNGQNIVFVTPCLRAAWISFRPTPGKAERKDKLEAWECALFRNEGAGLSSDLIREATLLTYALWGHPPADGLITFVKPAAIRSTNPGFCYLMAGWRRDGVSRKGLPRLRAPDWADVALEIPRISEWQWRGARGGRLRDGLETEFGPLPHTECQTAALESISC